jgi:hypothetical protein
LSISKKIRKTEKWSEIIIKANLDLNKSLNYIKAKDIKEISGEEPRLMAKIDSPNELPSIFKENNLIILPISRSEYVLAKGKGFHTIEEDYKKPSIHYSYIPIDGSVKSESYYLDYAFSCGLISRISNYSYPLFPTKRGRRTTSFKFKLNNNEIFVNRAQIEVDGQYENEKEILIFEAKIRAIKSFNIRQLYYPFRDLQVKKDVRIFFFTVDIKNLIFKFWEYTFHPTYDFEAIKYVNFYCFKLKIKKKGKGIVNVTPKPEKINIPQADDLEKIFLIVEKVNQGFDDSRKISNVLEFVKRQSSYYRHAGELLGIIKLNENKYEVTPLGEEYLKLNSEERKNFVCKLILEFPIINEIFYSVISNKVKEFKKDDIINLITKKSNLHGSTILRRTRTIISWFIWLEKNTGYVKVIDRKIIVNNIDKSLVERPILEILKKRKNPNLEFKASFRYHMKLKQPNQKVLEKVIAKTIAAFMNSEGGTLFIGVDDDGNIIGLENDYQLLKKKNSDGFELELRQSIEKYLKNKIANEFLKLKFHKIDSKEICEINVTPTPVPIFLYTEEGKQQCYVRIGNSSKPYNYEEFYQYCNRHFTK